jgi:hypothetical protein
LARYNLPKLMGPSGRAASPQEQLTEFLAKYPPAIVRQYRAALAALRRRVPGAVELVYDNYNGLVVGFSPTERPSEAVVSLLARPDHITLCFIQNGPDIPDPTGRLRGSGNVVRHTRLASPAEIDAPVVAALIRKALRLSDVPFDRAARRTMVIRAISKKQRPRRVRGSRRPG